MTLEFLCIKKQMSKLVCGEYSQLFQFENHTDVSLVVLSWWSLPPK